MEAENDGIKCDYSNGDLSLIQAIFQGNKPLLEHLINTGVNVNYKDNYGKTPLHYAAIVNDPEIMRVLLTAGADVNAQCHCVKEFSSGRVFHDGDTSLHLAARLSNDAKVKLILENGANVYITNTADETALHAACSDVDFSDIDDFSLNCTTAEYSAVIKGQDHPLHRSVSLRTEEDGKVPNGTHQTDLHQMNIDVQEKDNTFKTARTVQLIVENETNPEKKLSFVNAIDCNGQTALHQAAATGKVDVIRILLKEGADVNIRCNWNLLPIHVALEAAQLEAFEVLLSNSSKVSCVERCLSLLRIAALCNRGKICEFLLRHPLISEWIATEDKQIVTNTLHFHDVVSNNNTEIVKILLIHGCDVNTRNEYGLTPLRMALNTSLNQKTVEILLNLGADVNAFDEINHEGTILHSIVLNKRLFTMGLLDLFVFWGADIHAENGAGRTILSERYVRYSFFRIKSIIKFEAIFNMQGKQNEQNMRFIRSWNKLSNMYDRYCDELQRTRNHTIIGNITVWRILSEDIHYVVSCIKRISESEFATSKVYYQSYPFYAYKIYYRLKKAAEVRQIIDGVKSRLCKIIFEELRLPFLVANRILSYLSLLDMHRFDEAYRSIQ